MRNDKIALDEHQIVDPDPCPFPSAPTPLACHADRLLGPDLPRLVQEEPDLFALLHPTDAAGRVAAVIEHVGDRDLGGSDRLLRC